MNPFDIVKNINKKDGLLEAGEIGGAMFVVIRAFSNTPDTVLFANEANKLSKVGEEMQYRFLYHAITKNPKRFAPWNKQAKSEQHILNIMELYGYSRQKAEAVADLISESVAEQLVYKGGRK